MLQKINGPFLFGDKGTPAEYSAGLDRAVARGWLELPESGTYVKFTAAGADLMADKAGNANSRIRYRCPMGESGFTDILRSVYAGCHPGS